MDDTTQTNAGQGTARRNFRYKESVSPLLAWFLDYHVSKWSIAECCELLRQRNPRDVVLDLRAVEDGKLDPMHGRLDDVFELMVEHFALPATLRSEHAAWHRSRKEVQR